MMVARQWRSEAMVTASNSPSTGPLGRCPDCETELSHASVLIEYETGDSGQRRFAECPCCRDVVHPS
jgi:uncharacterized protein with PIN domain